TVRVPTEAEWEYSCRAGTATLYYSGDKVQDLDRVGWYLGNAGKSTHPVGEKTPNAFGLYDMHGNLWQWCQDWFAYAHYTTAPVENPHGAGPGTCRIFRGGSWRSAFRDCCSTNRNDVYPSVRYDILGFRVVVELPPRSK